MYLCIKLEEMSPFKFSKLLVFVFFLLAFAVQETKAQDYKSSLGGRLGTYVAASFTTYTSETNSVEVIAGITREGNESNFLFGGFYRGHYSVTNQAPTLKWYWGIGLYVNSIEEASKSKLAFAPSAMIGMEYTLEHAPVNFFLDLSPNYNTNSIIDRKFDAYANLGVRYVLSSQD